MPCSVPTTANGVYHHFDDTVASQEGVTHGEVLTLTCLPGFQLMGPDSLRCWYGDWAVESLPECVPSKSKFFFHILMMQKPFAYSNSH